MNTFDIASILILGAFAWAFWSATRKPSRGNVWIVTIVGVILGLDLGFTIAWRLYVPELRSFFSSVATDQLQTSMVSAAALMQLENGKNAEAKSFLAWRVAAYYRELKSAKALNAQQQKTLATLEELSSKSEILRQKIAEQTKQPEN
jgi:hypothetical protein